MEFEIREERPEDIDPIGQVTTEAFKLNEHSRGTEAAIITALRNADALTLSLVAMADGAVVGHIAFSPVEINGEHVRWYGLGPVSVRPDLQRQGIGSALIREGLARLGRRGAHGCVLVGDPAYYCRFGFTADPNLTYGGVPPEYFMRRMLVGESPKGEVSFHDGFGAT